MYKTFNIIVISETRISKKTSIISNFNLNNYSFESTPTEPSAGGIMLYISNHLSYKPQTDLNMCTKNQLESTFIDIINSKKGNIIISYVYKHPNIILLLIKYFIRFQKNKNKFFSLKISTLIC